jgi:hypothetical protein
MPGFPSVHMASEALRKGDQIPLSAFYQLS